MKTEEDVTDADRPRRDTAMRRIVGGNAAKGRAAAARHMGRVETDLLATDGTSAPLTDLAGAWMDKVHDRRPPEMIIVDMDSRVSLTYGEQQENAKNGHWAGLPNAKSAR